MRRKRWGEVEDIVSVAMDENTSVVETVWKRIADEKESK